MWCSCTTPSNSLNEEYALIPLPQSVTYSNEVLNLPTSVLIYADEAMKDPAEMLTAWLTEWKYFSSVGFGLSPEESCIHLAFDPEIEGEEAYELIIHSNGIRISANSSKGVFYGIQTLKQIVESELLSPPNKHALRGVFIKDVPRFKHRGMLLDCCRHFMEPDFVKRYIDLLAAYKMNVFHWHLTEDQGWRIEIDAYPRLTEIGAWRKEEDGTLYGGYYTKNDIRDIVAYAQERNVVVIPEIELPGHCSAAIAAYPWLSCKEESIPVQHEWGVFQDIYCAGKDSTFIFLQTVLDEVLELFPSPYIHIGGDEAPKTRWESCTYCQQRIKQEGLHDEHELQHWFIDKIGRYLQDKGRQIIGWDEIREGGIPQGAIIQSWRGMDGGIEAVRKGHEAIMSPTSHAYFDYGVNAIDLEKVYSFNPIPLELDSAEACLIRGGECNLWTEHIPQQLVDSKVFPRILAMAEVLWTQSDTKDYGSFYNRVQAHYPVLDFKEVSYGLETIPVKIVGHIEAGNLFVNAQPQIPGVEVCLVQDSACRELPQNGVAISGQQHLKFKVDRNGNAYGNPVEVDVFNHDALGLPVELKHPYSSFYTGGGDQALTDGFLGSLDFRDGRWQALQQHPMVATLDLGSQQLITDLSARFYFYNNAWIFFPTQVDYAVSDDGVEWTTVAHIRTDTDPHQEEQSIINYGAENLNAVGRFVRMTAINRGLTPIWHDAPNEPAWLFCDELVVQTK